jgi:tetratricopeptide (TPR) repeat protein
LYRHSGWRAVQRLATACAALAAVQCWAAADVAPTVRLSREEAIGLATRWLVEGHLDEAEALLRQLEQALPDDYETAFLSGQLALARKDYRAASTIFRRLLTRDPTLLRVRLDLARALFLAGDYDAARYHFEHALGHDLPETARQTVYLYLQRIETETSWLTVTVAVGPDSNPSYASSAETVDILGQPFVLSPDARARKAIGLTAFVQARHSFGAENRGLARAYLELRDFPDTYADYHYAQGTLGASSIRGDHVWTAEAGPLAARYQDATLYVGGLVQLRHASPVTPRLLASQTLTVKRLEYRDYDYLSADETWLNGQVRYALSAAAGVSLALSAGRNDTDQSEYSYDALDGALGFDAELARRFNVDVRVGYARYRYDGPSTLFGQLRKDRLLRLDFNVVARDWALRGFAPLVTAGYARNDSTISLLDYRRHYFGVGVTRSF